MSLGYSIHGTCQIVCENDIIKIDAKGPWNFEYFDYLHKELISYSSQVNLNNYCVLLNLSGEAIVVDGAIEKHLFFVKKSTVKAIGINLSDCSTINITKKIFQRGYGTAQIKHEFFQTEQDAINWLKIELSQ
ncbi:MAG: hypothetical protein P8I03_01505 [Thalassotalea sp.]|nr:hypothetical protein [Thalassotalea sp.]